MSQKQAQSKDAASDPLAAYEDEIPPPQRTGVVGFLLPVLLVGGLGAAGLFFYKDRVETMQKVGDRTISARDKVKRHDVASLKAAEALYQEILQLDPDNGRAFASLALTYFHMSEHGLDTMGKAKEFASKAEAQDVQSPDRFAVRAYIDITEGNAEKAEVDIRGLLEKDLGASRLAHALGWAMAAQGQYIEANRIIRQAQESDFSAVAFRLTLAQIAHLQGDERGAISHLAGIVRTNMNPDHRLAQAWLAALRLKNFGRLNLPVRAITQLKKDKDDLGPRTKVFLTWAESELDLALLKPDDTLKKVEEGLTALKDFAPLHDLKARAHKMKDQNKKALASYEAAVALEPAYRGIHWDLAKMKSKRKDDAALALVDALEKSFVGTKGPDFLLFRANHELRKGNLEEAKKLYTEAAELGDDPDILFGLAKITFEEEKKKGNKADLEKVGTELSAALDKKRYYPELHEYLAEISLWNYLVEGAHGEYQQAEAQYKKLSRPIPELVAFYDRIAARFQKADLPSKDKRLAAGFVKEWTKKKGEYLQSLLEEGT